MSRSSCQPRCAHLKAISALLKAISALGGNYCADQCRAAIFVTPPLKQQQHSKSRLKAALVKAAPPGAAGPGAMRAGGGSWAGSGPAVLGGAVGCLVLAWPWRLPAPVSVPWLWFPHPAQLPAALTPHRLLQHQRAKVREGSTPKWSNGAGPWMPQNAWVWLRPPPLGLSRCTGGLAQARRAQP